MSFNGSGTFNRIYSWVTDASNGLNISSSRMDTDTNDIAAGLSNCITKDGQQTVTANIPMSGFKFTGLGSGTIATDSATYGQLITFVPYFSPCEFRLTLTTGVPVTTSDVTGATTLYAAPYKGNRIALFDSSSNPLLFAPGQMSIAVPATTSTMYDVFCYNNSGNPALELLAWTNDTTRATALVTTNAAVNTGVLVKSGDPTRRYLGSFRTTGVSGQTEDSYAKRYVWNYYNRVLRPMRVIESTATWTYTTSAFRQANGSTANQLDFVMGWSEDAVVSHVHGSAKNTGTSVDMIVAIGLDSTTTMASGCINYYGSSQVANLAIGMDAQLKTFPGVGRHTLVWLELSAVSGTTTWLGTGGAPTSTQTGIHGEIWG